jgi:hypothetical protein
MAKEPQVAAAVGTATGGEALGDIRAAAIQAAMDRAALDCHRNGIVDPDKVRSAKLKAREKAKADHQSAQRKAARMAKGARR